MKKDIKKEILEQIKKEKVKIKPKSYFQILKGVIYGLSIILIVFTVYVFNLMFYLPSRTTRIVERAGINEYLSLFPWPLIIIGAAAIGILIYLYRNYEGGYKKHLLITTLIIFGISLIAGGALAKSNLNEKLEQRPDLRRMYDWHDDNFVPRGPRNRLRRIKEDQELQELNSAFIPKINKHRVAAEANEKVSEINAIKGAQDPIYNRPSKEGDSGTNSVIKAVSQYTEELIEQIKIKLKFQNLKEENKK